MLWRGGTAGAALAAAHRLFDEVSGSHSTRREPVFWARLTVCDFSSLQGIIKLAGSFSGDLGYVYNDIK